MIDGKLVLAVIPARGGSKRAPRKNIRPYRGKPLIHRAWESAMSSLFIDTICLSTEDEVIAEVAREKQMLILNRPAHLATDDATNEDVLRHALEFWPADFIVLLQPTSPHRTGLDIDKAIELAYRTDNAVVSYRPDGTKNGAVYVAPVEWLQRHDFTHEHERLEMPEERSLDIDYPNDFDR